MNIIKSGAKFSTIVRIGQDLKEMSKKTGEEYLYLNRGINNVVKIDLSEIIPKIKFNTDTMQFYVPTVGMPSLRKAINTEFFNDKSSVENISITSGGMSGLSLIFQILDLKKVHSHAFYWGAYNNILKIADIEHGFYNSFDDLLQNPENYKGSAVIICDPNNPVGDKYDDDKLIETINTLNEHNITVIWDGPYRRLFYENSDILYEQLSAFENVIITESFSKSIGLSGQRLGFIHCSDKKFNEELAIRLLYSSNGINAFVQILVEKILTTEEGKKAALDFKTKTVADIKANILFLKEKNLLADEFYKDSVPMGIFVVLNKSYEELLKHKIGSVPLNYFTKKQGIDVEEFSRICVSVPNEKFTEFFKDL